VNQGISRGLEGSIEKFSEALGAQANYLKTSRVSRLPQYLVVSFNRFDRKTTSDGVIGLKVLKPISFPAILDVHSICDEELGGEILAMRNKLTEAREAEDAKVKVQLELRDVDKKKLEEETAAKEAAAAAAMDVDELAAAEQKKKDDAIPENPMLGYYDLKAVVTHKGRALSSGHYMGWTKDDREGKDNWIKFDDDDVYEVPKEEIMKLSGGGDWDMAYLCIYKLHHKLP